jgi:hypothetical protein
MGQGAAYIFINLEQAAGFGHIGWGFHIAQGKHYFGSTDHLWRAEYPLWHPLELIRYMNVAPSANIDFWSQVGTREEMLETMRHGAHLRYHLYKELPVSAPDPLRARALVDCADKCGWHVIFNNCVHQTYRILTAYGAELPSPNKLAHRFPKSWFESVPTQPVVLTQATRRLALPPTTDQSSRRVG